MSALAGLSIRQKLIRVMMVTSVSSIGLTCLAFVTYEVTSFRDQVERELTSVAQVIGANTTAALSFDDASAASDTLAALSAEPRVVAARVFDRRGHPFADYQREGSPVRLPASLADASGQGVVLHRIVLHDDLLGHVYLAANAREVRDRVLRFVAIALAVLVVGSTLAYTMSAFLQGVVSRPLLALATTAEEVAVRRDYSLRATKDGNDETGQVIDRFNEMLSQIQARDLALREAHRVLETRVDERTQALKSKIDEQRHTEEELVIARDAAEAASRAKSAFLATMSHELRTPLNAIIGYSEMLTEEARDAGQTACVADLAKITTAGRHLLALINDILDLSKIEAGRMELAVEVFDLPPLLREVAASVQPLVEKNHNTLTVDVSSDVPAIVGDAMRVRQVLLNLVSNATKFTERGAIVVRARPGDGWVFIDVSDSGIGMTADEVTRLFHEFTQADASTTRKYGGSGLGLAISQRLCRLMGGRITVHSAPGQGSVFTVALPLRAPLSAADVTAAAASPSEVLHV